MNQKCQPSKLLKVSQTRWPPPRMVSPVSSERRAFRLTFQQQCVNRPAGREVKSGSRVEHEMRLTEMARVNIGAGYRIVCTTLYVPTSYTLTMWSRDPVNRRLALALKAMEVTVFWWFDMARMHFPPATKSHTRRIGPAEDRITVPEGNMSTCSTGAVLEEAPFWRPKTISASPLRLSNNRTVPSYEPVSSRWGEDVENWPDRT